MQPTKKISSNRQAGVTLVEMLIVLAVASALLIMSYTLLEDAARTSMFVEVRNDLPVLAQNAMNTVQAEAFQGKMLFDASTGSIGPGYLGAVKYPTVYPALTDTQLPIINSAGELVPDSVNTPATRYTGNCLLLARQLAPILVSKGGAAGNILLDRYQFELVYLTKRTDHKFKTSNFYIDLIQAKSEVYADYNQIAGLSVATERTAVTTAIASYVDPTTNRPQPIKKAWNPGQPIANAIYSLPFTGAGTPAATPQIDLSTNYVSLLKGISTGHISGRADYSVAFQPTAGTKYPIPDVLPKYATYDSSKPLFPSGAEFLIVGPAGSRRLLGRLVLMANYSVGNMTSKEVEVITSVR